MGPLGIFATLTLQVRLLFQSLWQLRVSWDEQLPDSVCITFMKAMKAIMDLQEYKIPRRLLPDFHTDPLELHGFCDGGELAYGAVIWLRYRIERDFKLKILTSKAYVTPIKKRSIPRLELMAAVILARLITTIRTVVYVAKVTLWTDSAILLYWLHTPVSNFKPFVSTRIKEILKTVPVMGFKILRTGSFLYRTYQQQVPSFPAMGFKILRIGFPLNRTYD